MSYHHHEWIRGAALLFAATACGAGGSDADGGRRSDATRTDAALVDGSSSNTCAMSPACPMPDEGRVSVCGTLVEGVSGVPLAAASAEREDCQLSPSAPACQISVTVIDANQPDVTTTATMDSCGRFATLVDAPPLNVVSIEADDASTGPPDAYVTTIISTRLLPDEVVELDPVRAIALASDMTWTAAAGAPFGGDTFADTGTVVLQFFHQGTAVAGVAVTVDGSGDGIFYFSDTEPNMLGTLEPSQSTTGANGTAFATAWGVYSASGGGLPAGCQWPALITGGTPGMFLFERVVSECN